jgi:DNA-binding HxlR family transcriptional regulator
MKIVATNVAAMPTSRTYGDGCGIARALDVVGERWAILVVRELLFGPQRFSDIRRGLPNASSNLVADRLRELEERGVIQRRKLAPPTSAWVYELTEWGRELEPVILALGGWGLLVPFPEGPLAHSASSMMLFLRGGAHPDPQDHAVYRVQLGESVFTVRARSGRVLVELGEPREADAAIRTDPSTFNALLAKPAGLRAAMSDGRADVSGDLPALRRLLRSVEYPDYGAN